MNKTNTEKIEILSLADSINSAIKDILGISIDNYPRERIYMLPSEDMKGNLAFLYDMLCKLRIKKWDAIAQDFIEKTNFLERPGVVIDVGCGPGYLLKALYRHLKDSLTKVPDIWGVDSSAEMIELFCHNNKDTIVRAAYGNIYELSEFVRMRGIMPNYIIIRSVLNRLIDFEKGLKEAVSALLPEGKIYIREVLRNSQWETYKGRVLPLLHELPEYPVEDFLLSYLSTLLPEEVIKVLEGLNLNIISSDGMLKGSSGEDIEFSKELEFVIVGEKHNDDFQ
jgi:ubiquinone/menaquinone biosynthesis C-methylase UbiE